MTRLLALGCLAASMATAQTPPNPDPISDSVGQTEFRTANVSGNLTITIPINTPRTPGDAQPELSLTYVSTDITSPLGVGFTIGGLSEVTRCRRATELGDGEYSPAIRLQQTDAFCLDGVRLLLVQGQTYGDDGAEYRPETDPRTRVFSRGGNNSPNPLQYLGPDSFEVHRADGTTSYYGQTSNSKLQRVPCGTPQAPACANYSWSVSRTVDSSGNYVDFSYLKNPAVLPTQFDGSTVAGLELHIARVAVGGKLSLPGQPSTSFLPYAFVDFDYQTLAPAHWRYTFVGGTREVLSRELTRIRISDTTDAGQVESLTSFKLTYNDSGSGSSRRLLSRIEECSGDETVCLRPLLFTWHQDATGPQPTSPLVSSTFDSVAEMVDSQFGDVDGDGRQDFVWVNTNRQIGVAFARTEQGTPSLSAPQQSYFQVPNSTTPVAINLVDMDGDGREDLLIPYPVAGALEWRAFRSLGRPTTATARVFDTTNMVQDGIRWFANSSLGDFNGDGLIDLFYDTRPAGSSPVPLGDSHRIRLMEFVPGKGARFTDEFRIRVDFPADQFCSVQNAPTRYCRFDEGSWGIYQRFLEDFDGDGRADLFTVLDYFSGGSFAAESGRWHILTHSRIESATGSSPGVVVFSQSSYSGANSDGTGIIRPSIPGRVPNVADYNADGLPDLVYYWGCCGITGKYRLAMNNGGDIQSWPTIELAPSFGFTSWDSQTDVVFDTNGNGKAELIKVGATQVDRWEWFSCSPIPFQGCMALAAPIAGQGCLPAQGQSTCGTSLQNWKVHFSDFSGDGQVEFVIHFRSGSRPPGVPQIAWRLGTTRNKPRDVISQVTSGQGARTQIAYQPLSNRAVYVKDVNSRADPDPANNAVNSYGRGSKVLDIMGGMYVVSELKTSAPTEMDAAAVSRVLYRYAGAKAQAGSRGFLGFREVTAFDIDDSVAPQRIIATTTTFRQDFPFIGAPSRITRHLRNGVFLLDPNDSSGALEACFSSLDAVGHECFRPSTGNAQPSWSAHPDFGGVLFSRVTLHHACKGNGDSGNGDSGEVCQPAWNSGNCPADLMTFPLVAEIPANTPAPLRSFASARPLFTFVRSQDEFTFDLVDGSLASRVSTGSCHEDAFGNVTQTAVATADHNSEKQRQLVTNRYTNFSSSGLPLRWRTGRLIESLVVVQRPASGSMALQRGSRRVLMEYDLDSLTMTGLLTSETVIPGPGMAFASHHRLRYFYDEFGNRVIEIACGSDVPVSECDDPGDIQSVPMRPTAAGLPLTYVRRFSRTEFDSRPGASSKGRYPDVSRLPFSSATSGNGWVERAAWSVLARDGFGTETHRVDSNGAEQKARVGRLGNAFWSLKETVPNTTAVVGNIVTGIGTTTSSRWCRGTPAGLNEVECPWSAVLRRQFVSRDLSGNVVSSRTWSYLDVLGREVLRVSENFNDPNDPALEGSSGFLGRQLTGICTFHDRKGRRVAVSEPFFLSRDPDAGGPNFGSGSYEPCRETGRKWTRFSHDALDRLIRTDIPNGGFAVVRYGRAIGAGVSPLAVETRTFRGQGPLDVLVQREERNPMGEVVGISDQGALAVTYDYDAFGQLVSIRRDAGAGEVRSVYTLDGLGRRVSELDPDSGLTQIDYNGLGERIRTRDARGYVIEEERDARGRVWRRRSFEPLYSVGGTLSGLASGSSVGVQLNSGEQLQLGVNGPFVFSTYLPPSSRYAVTISQNPAGQTCSVEAGAGVVANSNLASVLVDCRSVASSIFSDGFE